MLLCRILTLTTLQDLSVNQGTHLFGKL